MRLLLTGASGFLGRHIIAAARQHTVFQATRAASATEHNEIALGRGSWTKTQFSAALASARPDVVLHCAGSTHSPDAETCFAANTALAAELLDAVADMHSPPRVLLIGSAAEYGFVAPDAQPVTEMQNCEPRTRYGVAKHAQTLLGMAAGLNGLTVLTARLFNPAGVGMPGHLALPSFARRIAASRPDEALRVGDLTVERDFIDVVEAARLLVGLAGLAAWPWPVVNLCSGHSYRLHDLLTKMVWANGSLLRFEQDPKLMRHADMPTLVGCTKRLISVGLNPRVPDFASILPELMLEARNRAEVSDPE